MRKPDEWPIIYLLLLSFLMIFFFLLFCCLHNETPCIGWENQKKKKKQQQQKTLNKAKLNKTMTAVKMVKCKCARPWTSSGLGRAPGASRTHPPGSTLTSFSPRPPFSSDGPTRAAPSDGAPVMHYVAALCLPVRSAGCLHARVGPPHLCTIESKEGMDRIARRSLGWVTPIGAAGMRLR